MATDCPEPEKCRRCRKEGHKVDECPEPEKCFNCREEGHKVGHLLFTLYFNVIFCSSFRPRTVPSP